MATAFMRHCYKALPALVPCSPSSGDGGGRRMESDRVDPCSWWCSCSALGGGGAGLEATKQEGFLAGIGSVKEEDDDDDDDRSTVTEDAGKAKRSGSAEPEPGFETAAGGSVEQRISCSEQMSRVARDVVGELVRRNDEKREANRVLRRQVERMAAELGSLAGENAELHSKLKGVVLAEDGKKMGGCPRCSSYGVVPKKRRSSHFAMFKSLFL